MKNILVLLIGLFAILYSCKKDEESTTTPPPATTPDNYSSMADFYSKNAVPTQTFTVNSNTGGTFTATKGTQIVIPPNTFMNDTFGAVTGNVQMTFREVYTKSEMFFAGVNTGNSGNSDLLISGGMFYINVKQGMEDILISNNKSITVKQPFSISKEPSNQNMKPFVFLYQNFPTGPQVWVAADDTTSMSNYTGSLLLTATDYIYTLNQMYGGIWSNTDDPTFFNNFNRVGINFQCTQQIDSFHTELYVMFKNENCMVHVYSNGLNQFDFQLAPDGVECTAVAVGVKDGKLYSAIVPLTISNSLIVNVTLSETTTDEFKGRLRDLD